MKKLFAVLTISAFLLTSGLAMAGTDKEGPGIYRHSVTGVEKFFNKHPGMPSQWTFMDTCEECIDTSETVTGAYQYHVWDFGSSLSQTGNDFGYAGGYSGIGAEMETFADAEGRTCKKEYMGDIYGWGRLNSRNYRTVVVDNEASQQGLIFGENETKAWSWAKDYGQTSKAGAGVKADEGWVFGEATAKGKNGDREFVADRLVFHADFYQENGANEVGYLGGGISAYNQSGLEYTAFGNWDVNSRKDFALGIVYSDYTPDVKTKGKSEVTIDPYGDNRSFEGFTENSSRIAFTGCRAPQVAISNANVFGNGIVSGGISNGGAFVSGASTFDYSGYTAGEGQAQLSGQITATPNGSTSGYITGSSSAVANGNPK